MNPLWLKLTWDDLIVLRYGTGSALLLTNYGGSELSQAFCRVCAVNGGIYVLRREVEEILLEDGAVSGILTTAGDRVNSKHVFVSSMFDPGRLGELINNSQRSVVFC